MHSYILVHYFLFDTQSIVEKMWNRFHPLLPTPNIRSVVFMGFGHTVPLALMITADKRIHMDGINRLHGRQFVPSDQIFHTSQIGLLKIHSVLEHLSLVQPMQNSLCCLTLVVCPQP